MKYYLKRIGFLVLSLWMAATLNFLIPRLMPGNPAQNLIERMQGRIDARELHALMIQFGVSTDPLWKQYLQYLWDILHGEFGISVTYFPVKVTTVIATALPWTIGLIGVATIIAAVLGTLLGIVAAWKRNSLFDSIQSSFFIFLSGVPAFWLALILLWYFGFKLNWFPLYHGYSDGAIPNLSLSFILNVIHHLFIPAFAIIVTALGGWMLGMRNNMIQILGDDYVLFAEAKGIASRDIMMNYAARNAMLPSFTSFGMALAGVVGGSILIESLFSLPGLGMQLGAAIGNQDYALTQGLFLIISTTTLVANFIVDMMYGRIDPRVRVGGAQ